MAFTTHLQQVLSYLKAGHPVQPPAGAPLPEPAPMAGSGLTPQIKPVAPPKAAKPVRKA